MGGIFFFKFRTTVTGYGSGAKDIFFEYILDILPFITQDVLFLEQVKNRTSSVRISGSGFRFPDPKFLVKR